jgi:hypothetical protein
VGRVGGVGCRRSDLCRKLEEVIGAGRSERRRARRRDDGAAILGTINQSERVLVRDR